MFFVTAEAQTYYCRVVKLCFLSSYFEYQDLFVGSRITYPSESYLSRKVMSEVSVSRRRRNPSAQSALPLTCTLTCPQDPVIDIVEKARKSFWQKSFRALRLVRQQNRLSERELLTLSFSGPRYRSSQKARKMIWQKDFFRGKF
jgi:hypothetical protein